MTHAGVTESVKEILVLFDQAVSQDASFVALRDQLDGAKPVGRYLRLLAADQGHLDADAAKALALSRPDLEALQLQTLHLLRSIIR